MESGIWANLSLTIEVLCESFFLIRVAESKISTAAKCWLCNVCTLIEVGCSSFREILCFNVQCMLIHCCSGVAMSIICSSVIGVLYIESAQSCSMASELTGLLLYTIDFLLIPRGGLSISSTPKGGLIERGSYKRGRA